MSRKTKVREYIITTAFYYLKNIVPAVLEKMGEIEFRK